jgi:predicted acyltransferase
MSVEPPVRPARVVSIDALRGLDTFMITGGHHLAAILGVFFAMPRCIQEQMQHVRWEGFSAWDLIMPLFLLIVGTFLPFSFGKRLKE